MRTADGRNRTPTLTYKNGFIVGLVAGFLSYLASSGELSSVSLTAEQISGINNFAGFLILLSAVIAIISAFRKKSTLTTTGDGLVYGFTIGFDLPTYAIGLNNGQLPTP